MMNLEDIDISKEVPEIKSVDHFLDVGTREMQIAFHRFEMQKRQMQGKPYGTELSSEELQRNLIEHQKGQV
jgi:hypothetical protein